MSTFDPVPDKSAFQIDFLTPKHGKQTATYKIIQKNKGVMWQFQAF